MSLTLGSGAFSNPPPASSTQPQQNGTHSNQTSSTTHLDAPPGVPPPSGLYSQQTHAPGNITNATGSAQVTYTSNGAPGDSHSTNNLSNNAGAHQTSLQPNSISHSQQHPQTPAEQVLVSAADRWGLLGLLAMLKNAGTDLDQGLNGIGTDLGTMGLDMAFPGCVGTFVEHFRTYSETNTEIYIPRSSHHGRTNRQHAQWNLISTSLHVIRVYRHHLLVPTRQLHSAMRRFSSCSIQVPGMRYKKLPHKNCAYSLPA